MPLHGEIVVIKRNGTDGTHFPLTAKSCLFGRKTECDIRIQLPHVSKEHCKVEVKDNGEVFVTNLSSVNPTQLNGTTVKQPIRLKHGDIITVIDRSFRFEKPTAQQGKRRSTGLDSDTFKVFASNQSSDTNETVRIETLLTAKTQRKSEGNITKTAHSRRSLQISSSSEPRNDLSPFGELYEMFKSKVGAQKENGKTPVKDKSSSPKNVAQKRSLQIQDTSQSPAPKRNSRRSQSSDSPVTRPKEVVVEPRSASAGRVREASKSPSRSPKTSMKSESSQGEATQELDQTKRRSSSKLASQSLPQEQVPSSSEKRSPRRSASAEQRQVISQVQSATTPDSSTPRRRSGQSVPEEPVLKNQDPSPRGKSPTQGRRSASLDKSPKETPNKPLATKDKTSEAEPRKSPRKRRSDELSLPDPPPKRKRVSFGGHLSPELFDKRLPPNSPLKKGATPARRSLSLNSPRTVIRKSFGLKQSVIREVFEQSERSSKSSPKKDLQASKSPSKPSASVKTPAKSPSPARKATPVKNSPAKKSPVKTPPSAKITPVKKSPSAKSPVKSPSRSPKKIPVSTTPVKTPAKRSPVAKTPTPAKRSPVAKTPTPAKRSPVAKTPTPAKRSPVAKTPTPATPYTKGRFSVSRIATPPQEQAASKLPTSQTPKTSRKSLSVKKTPRRSRKLEAFELIRSKRRSGATEANLIVSRTWADVVKIGVAKSQKIDNPVRKVAAAKKKLKHKTPMKKLKDLTSTGHADSPATILVGRAHTRTVNLTGYVPKVVRNQAVKLDTAHNESFTGVAELFSTPASSRRSNRLSDSPSSAVVEMSVMQTPEESGEMVVSPLNSPNTTRRKQYSRDAVSRLLQSPASPELDKDGSATLELTEEPTESQKDKRKSVGLSGVKRIMRTPKQKGEPVTDPHALRKLLRTPKETESPRASSRRSTNLEVLGIDRLVKTPKQKGVPVEEFSGLQRIMKTPKQRVEPVEDLVGVKRIMKTPKEKGEQVEDLSGVQRIMKTPKQKGEPVEDLVGVKRIMRTPKEKSQPVEDMIGIKRIMRTPKEKGQPVEDIALNHLMHTPVQSVQSTESTQPIEEIFGIRNLIKTPPKSAEKVVSAGPRSRTAKSLGNASVHRGRPAKRLSLVDDTASGNDALETVQSQIVQESTTQSNQEVVTTQKRGRPSKGQSISSPEVPKEQVVSDEVTSPRRRPSSTAKVLYASDVEVTSLTQHETTKAMVEPPKESVPDGKITSPARKGRSSTTTDAHKESVSDAVSEVTSPRRRGRPSSTTKTPKESLAVVDAEVTTSTAVAESVPIADRSGEVVSPRRRGRPSSTGKATKESLTTVAAVAESVPIADGNVTSPTFKGRLGTTAELSESDVVSDVTSPRRRGRPSSATKDPAVSDGELESPTSHKGLGSNLAASGESVGNENSGEVVSPRRRGRPSSTGKAPKESLTADAEVTKPAAVVESVPVADTNSGEVISPRRRGRPSSTRESLTTVDAEVSNSAAVAESVPIADSNSGGEVVSPRRRGRPSSTGKAPKESLTTDAEVTKPVAVAEPVPIADSNSGGEVVSPRRRGRPSSATKAPKEAPAVSEGELVSPTSYKGLGSNLAASGESALIADNSGEVISPRRRGRPSSTGKAPKESHTVDAEVAKPAAVMESVPIADSNGGEVVSPRRRGRPSSTGKAPKESLTTDAEVTKYPTHKGRLGTTAEPPKESVSEVKSPTRRGRPSASAVTDESVLLISPVVEERPSATTEVYKESLPTSEVTFPARRGRPQKSTAPVLAESVPIGESKLTSPSHKEKTNSVPDVSKESVSEVTSPTSEIAKDPIPVAESKTTSQTRRGRQKAKLDLPQEPSAVEVQVTRGSRSKGTAETAELSVSVTDELPTTQTRRGRQKASAQVAKVSASVPEVDVNLPTGGSISKAVTEAPKDSLPVSNDVAVAKQRRGRAKVTYVKESVVDGEATTHGSRSKDAAVDSVPAEEAVPSQKRRGRFRKADAPKESAAVSNEVNSKSTEVAVSDKVTSPTRKGRSRNTEVPTEETAPVTDGITSPNESRQPETTDGELDLSPRPSEDANEKTAKSTKKTVRQNVKKSSKQSAEELLQAPEPEESITPVAEKKTQPPPPRGRRKATQSEPVSSEGDANSSLAHEQTEKLTIETSPMSRRGGRRRNAELSSTESDVVKPKTSKQETRSRGQSKSKVVTVTETENTASEEPVKSPEPTSPKISARQAQDLATEPTVESQPKSLRGRANKRKDESTEESHVDTSETVPEPKVSQKAAPAKGRSRAVRDVSNVSGADEQAKGSSAKQQRGSRRNQTLHEDSQASHEDQATPVALEITESSTRGTQGKKSPDIDEPNSVPEVKGRKNARGKNVEEQTVSKSKTKSVQWHPLLATEVQSTTEESAQDSTEVSTRSSRIKGKTRTDASELQVPAKRSRRGNTQVEVEETPTSTSPESLTVSDVAPRRRGRKANVQEEDTDAKSASESTVSAEVVTTSPPRGRRGASAKVVNGENNELGNVEPSTSRRQRGVEANKTSLENESIQSPVKSKSQKAGSDKAAESSAKSTRGVKRKQPNTEPETPSQASEPILVETENIPAGRSRKNQRAAKMQKGEEQEAPQEKPTVTPESPAKRRKTEAATTTAQKKSSRQTSKLENEKPSAATKTRTSTRSRK